MESANHEFIMAYSQEEMRRRVEELKSKGYRENDIHVLVHDKDVLSATTDLDGIHTHETGSTGSKFKTFFTGRDTVREELKKLNVKGQQIDTYQEDLENGAILLYTEGSPAAVEQTTHNKNSSTDVSSLGSEEIYTSKTSREEQYGMPSDGDKVQDSRLKGDEIHPTTGGKTMDETSEAEKLMEHEPGIDDTQTGDVIDSDDGVRRKQEDESPGIDPNLGPAPFGRDSEEEHLLNGRNQDSGEKRHRSDNAPYSEDKDKRPGTPPSPKLF